MSAPETPVVEGRAIVQDYHVPGGMFARAKTVRALKGVDFRVDKGKTLAIVGESGSGKSTLARIIALIDAPTGGELRIAGERIVFLDDLLRRAAHLAFGARGIEDAVDDIAERARAVLLGTRAGLGGAHLVL